MCKSSLSVSSISTNRFFLNFALKNKKQKKFTPLVNAMTPLVYATKQLDWWACYNPGFSCRLYSRSNDSDNVAFADCVNMHIKSTIR